ncbi:fibronectin type III domain-containing protein [Flavobacterium sp.]|uniref:fibronectin type III domain-containing protein n=1 Tax=Flavobacterium sp. TaxID=239 RepID=UPI003752F394
MKKITLLIITLLFSLMGYSQFPTAGIEGFEGTTGADLPAPTTPSAWTLGTGATGNQWAVFDNGVGLTRRWNITSVAANVYSGANSAYMDRENIGLGNSSEDYLATPRVTVPLNGQLRFWTRSTQNGANPDSQYIVKVSTITTAGSQTTIANYNANPIVAQWTDVTLSTAYNVYEEKVVDLSAFAGQNVFIAFVLKNNQSTGAVTTLDRWLIDGVRLVQRCLEPTNLTAGSITQTSASLSWTNPSGSTSWEIEVTNTAPTGSGVIYNGSLPYNASGLLPSTGYVYYVRSLCTDASSNWVGPFNFTTTTPGLSCVAPITISSLLYTTTDNTSNYGDTTDTTQPSACAGTTTNYMTGNDVFYSYTPTTTGAISITMTPGAANTGIFVYQGCANVGVTCLAGVANATSGIRTIPSLNVIAGQQYIIVLSSTTASQTYGYTLVIQQLNCAQPGALAATNISLTGAQLSWSNPGAATSWEYVLQPAGTAIPSGAGTPTSSNTNTPLSSLTPDTAYQYWVRASCGNGTFSAWSGPFLFNTLVPPPACGAVFTDAGGSSANYADNADSTVTICPATTGDVVTVTFTSFSTQATFDGLYIFNGNSTSATQFSSSNPSGSVPGGLAGSYWGTTSPGSFTSSSPDGCLTFRFRSDANTSDTGWTANVTCGLPPVCPKPISLTASAVLSGSVNLAWTEAGSATAWQVIALPCGSATPTAATTGWVNAPTNPYTLTGLTGETCYDIYVRSICSVTDSSNPTGPVTITTTVTPPACGGTFSDPGGIAANYANSTDSTVTICPLNVGDLVTVTFTTFFTEANWDGLYVFDGNSISSPLLATNNPAGFVPGGLPGSYWGDLTGNLPGPFTSTSTDGCLTFRFRSDGSVTNPGWTANVTCAPAPTCQQPNTLSAINATDTTVQLSWTSPGTATSWQVIAVAAGSPAPLDTATGWTTAPTNPFTLTGLTPNFEYEYYVRGNCGTVDGLSLWSGPIAFTTLPTCAIPTTLSVTTLTTSATVSWTQGLNPNGTTPTAWEVLALPCGSALPTATTTGAISALSNPFTVNGLTPDTCYTFYVRAVCSTTDSSPWSQSIEENTQQIPPACGGVFTDLGGANANYTNGTDYTVTICPTIPGEQVTVTFTDFFTEANWDGLYVFDGNSITSQQLATSNGGGNVPGGLPGSYWGNLTGANLPGPFTASSLSGCLTFRFRSDASVNNPGWIANVTCAPPPTCPKPTAVVVTNVTQTGATISWTEISTATTWEVLILPAGSPLPTASSVGIITTLNPYVATGLTSGTPYVVYVRSICSSSDISLWSSVVAFTTLITNDECANAIVAPVNTTTTCTQTVGGTVIGATPSSQPNACGGTDDDDVWFQFTATSTTHTINLLNITGSTADLYHVLYSGTCGALTQLYCSDPNTSTANNLVVGQTYFIRVYTWTGTGNQTSTFNLCIGTPVPPPSCITNTPAGNTCAVATPICNLNGYCGNTSATYTSDSWPQLSTAFCGSLENNSFLTFTASSSTISFDVWVTSSQDNNGIQIMIFGAATCGSGPVTSYTCWSPGFVPAGSTNISATGLTPGNTYYIMIDGFAGDVCDYVIATNSGIQTPIVINTSTSTTTSTICLGQSASLTASGGNGIYSWSPATNLNTTSGSTVVFSPTAVGSYTLTATSTDNNPLCPQSGSSSQTIIVTDIVPSQFTQVPSFCEGSTAPVLPTTSNNGISGTWSPMPVSNVAGTTTYTFTPSITQCAYPTTMDVTVNSGVIPTFLSPAPICVGAPAPILPTSSNNLTPVTGSWFPTTVSNTASGTYTFTPNPGQCASTTTINVTVNNNCDFGSYANAVWLTNCSTSDFFNTVGSGTDIIGPISNVFPNSDLGTYIQNSSALILRGAEVKTFKNASANVCSARLNYRIYPQSGVPGAFQVMNLPFFDNCGGTSFPTGGSCQTGDQKWQMILNNSQSPIDLTSYAPGNYVIEVYYDVTGDINSTVDCDDNVIINNNGANYSATYTIQSQPIYTSTNPTMCNGVNGTITISGLAPGETYGTSYQDGSATVGPINLTATSNGEIIINSLNSGTYSNFLLSVNGCSFPYLTPIVLFDPSIPTVSVNSLTVCQSSPATVVATPIPAGNYVYTWTVPTGATNPGNVSSFNALVSGTYAVVVTSTVTGCSSNSASGTILINPNPTVTVNSPSFCVGNSTAVTATPGVAGTYNYTWTVPTGATDPGNVASFIPTISGSYSVVINDVATGCVSSSVTSIVIINPVPVVTLNSPTVCQGQTATLTANVGSPGVYTYTWTVPAGATNPGNVSTFNATVSGTYSVVISNTNSLCNQDFETPCGVPAGGMSFVNQTSFSCWNTTATDGIIEVWSSGNEGVTSYSGNQFVELNANQVSSLYQNLSVLPGSTVNIAFAHRGRFSGTDVLELQVGPVGGPYTSLGQFSAQPAAWVYNNVMYTFPNNGVSNYTVRFVSISSGSGNNTVGNFIDAVSINSINCPSIPAIGTVTINPTVVPTFNTIAPLCSGIVAPLLPSSSTNTTPVTGVWFPSSIDTSVAGNSTYTFTPDAGQCSNPISIVVTVNSVATPTVNVLVQPTCSTPTGTIEVTSPVSGSSTVATDLFISEVTDSNAGSLSYIELYNGTASAINLSTYSLKTASNGGVYSFTLPLNNVSLPSGSTYVVALGNDNFCPSITGGNGSLAAQTNTSGSVNFSSNGNDHFGLFNGTALVDSWGIFGNNNWAPSIVGTEGADFRRKNNVTLPSATYNNNDWNVLDYAGSGVCANNDYSNIGTYTTVTSSTYQYNVDAGTYQTSPVFAGLAPGSHVVTVLDTLTGCISSSVTVVLNAIVLNPSVTTISYTTPVCSNVSPTLTPNTSALGFTTGGVYTATPAGLSINSVSGIVDLTLSSPGTYIVDYSVSQNNTLCLSAGNSTFTLVINGVPTVSVNSPTVCQGLPAIINTVTNPSSATYSYVWTVPSGATNPGDVASFTATVSGTYSVVITNTTTGCSSISASSTVTINTIPTVSVNSPTICQGIAANVVATTSAGSYSYTWTVPAGATNPGNVNSFTATASGSYSVVITNTTTGCSSTSATSIVTINSNPVVTVNSVTVCQGSQATITASPATNGSYSYLWTVPVGATNPGNVSTFNTLISGTYSVVITNTLTGCSSLSASGTATFIPSFDFTINGECVNNNYTLEVIPSSGSFDVSTSNFSWQLVSTSNINVGTNSPTFDVTSYYGSATASLPATFAVNVTTVDGCVQSHTIILDRIYCQIQRGISPNGDGDNEYFDLKTLGVQKLSIYNRYGSKVYSRFDYTDQWVGQADSGNELPDGTYYYVIEFKNNQSSKTGWIYINREIK